MFHFRLSGTTFVCIDRANIRKSKIDPKWLYGFLHSHDQIDKIKFYFGTDTTRQSRNFLHKINKIGYEVITKDVKYIDINPTIKIRKADFDVEITKDILLSADKYDHYIIFCGDGDLRCVYDYLVSIKKRVTVIHLPKGLGKEIHEIRGIIEIFNLDYIIEKTKDISQ